MSSRDLFAASRDLLVNIKDFLVICDPTKVININNHHLHPINSPHGEEVGAGPSRKKYGPLCQTIL